MKTLFIIVLFVALSLGSAFTLLSEEQCSDINQVNSPICNLIPAPCLRPICAEDTSDNSNNDGVWFKSLCHLISYNIACRGTYRIVSETDCPAESAPTSSPGVCPIQIPPNFIPFLSRFNLHK